MRLKNWLGAVVVGSALLLGACQPKQPPARPPVSPPERPSGTAALSPADYVALAASIDLFEVQSSELALARTATPRLRDYAIMAAAAHNGTAAQLSFAGRRLNLLPSARLMPAHQAMLDALAGSSDFDSTYRRQQVAVHRVAARLHADFAASGGSPTLRPVAASAARIERSHLERAQGL